MGQVKPLHAIYCECFGDCFGYDIWMEECVIYGGIPCWIEHIFKLEESDWYVNYVISDSRLHGTMSMNYWNSLPTP